MLTLHDPGDFWFGEIIVFLTVIKFAFLAFPSNSSILEFLNINVVQLLSVIRNNGAQSDNPQIQITGKILGGVTCVAHGDFEDE